MGGLGIVEVPESANGKLFYAFYGIFVGLSFAASVGIVLAPVAHRVLHLLHLDDPSIDDSLSDDSSLRRPSRPKEDVRGQPGVVGSRVRAVGAYHQRSAGRQL